MRLWLYLCLITFLCNDVFASESSDVRLVVSAQQRHRMVAGGNATVSLRRLSGSVEGCWVTSPGTTEPQLVTKTNGPAGVIWASRPTSTSVCNILVGPVDKTLFGQWTLSSYFIEDGIRIEARQPFVIEEDDGTITLSTISHLTHKGTFIDINLSQTGVAGKCWLKEPLGSTYLLDSSLTIYGVRVHHSSKFVSCRVTIGPMAKDLLGDWVLSQRVAGERERKQPVSIQWANPSDPESISRDVISGDVSHVVSVFGDVVSISASYADGIFEECFLMTPDEAVIPVTADRKYPGITFREGNSISPCNAAIGPIDDYMEGNWNMSTIFNNNGRLIEIQKTLVISRNTALETVLPPIVQFTNVGAFVDINLNAIGNEIQSCSLVTPNDEVYKLDGFFDLTGVTVRGSSRLVTCHVTIGPMTAELLGQWTLIEYHAYGFQRRRPINIAWANLADPISEPRQLIIDAQQNVVVDATSIVTVFVAREEGFDEGCFVVTPDGYVLPISDVTSYPGVVWNFKLTNVTACSVTFGPLDKTKTGRWILVARFNNGGLRIEKQQPVNLALADGTTTLPLLEHQTHSDAYVDISLNRTENKGNCYLKDPTGDIHPFYFYYDTPGITIHDSDLFVSCRVTIGPMWDYLLGEWFLIEKHTNESRIQPVSISWIDSLNPHKTRLVTETDVEVIKAGLGSILSTSIGRQIGMFEGCFITVPHGATLPIFFNTAYPAVKFLDTDSVTSCGIQIGPVHSDMAGNWTLSAKFNNHGVLTELQKTIIFFIRDDSSIFITPMPRQFYLTNVGATVDINLSNTGGRRYCRLITPGKQEYLINEGITLSGVTIQKSNKFVACRVTIGPMTEDLLGEWILIEEDSPNTARKQIAQISWTNPWDPTTEARQLVISAQQNNALNVKERVTVLIRREEGFEEGCFVITPDGAVLPISESFNYPGVTWHSTSVSACSVVFGPMDADMVGTWNLAARFNNGGTRVETRQPVNLILKDVITTLPLLEYSTYKDALVDINLNQTGVIATDCYVRNPVGKEFQLVDVVIRYYPDYFVSCRMTIGPMTELLLGKWTLIGQYEDGTERHQPVSITWINPSDPTEKRHEFFGANIILQKAIGSVTSTSIARLDGVLEGCFMITPTEALLPVFPNTRYPGFTFLGTNSLTSCIVQIGPIHLIMEGKFKLIARYNNYGTRTEIQNMINIRLSDMFPKVITLPRQVHLTNIGATIDISLKRTRAAGTCRLLKPSGREYILNVPVALQGVTVHNGTKFVSCRVTIGPMTEELLGDWILSQDEDEILKQQPARFLWANPWNPSAEVRQLLIATEQNNAVEVGYTITVSIRREEGFEEGCSVITPDGAVLPISEIFNYPGIEWHFRPTGVSACSVDFGPMDNDMVGRWTLAARFNSGGRRLETRQPIRLTLEDGTTTLPTLEYLIHREAVADINLNQTGIFGTCILRDTKGQEFTLNSLTNIPGVTVYNSNRFVSCRLSLGPIDDSLLGEWTLIHQQTDGRRRLQPVIVSWINPMDPTEVREIETGTEQNIHTRIGSIISTSIERLNGLLEGCFMTTPDGAVLPVFHHTRYPGVVYMGTNSVTACVVRFGPIHNEMAGKWTLAARFNLYGERSEIRNNINIIVEEEPSLDVTTYPLQEHLTYVDANVDISLNQKGVNRICHLTTPSGEEYILDGPVNLPGVMVHSNSSFVSCRVTIGPITEELLGDWILSQQDSDTTLRQQPATISWANALNPSEKRQLIITAQQNNVVDRGQTLNVSVRREDGFGEGCFVTTPNEEVLPITENIEYPGIRWAYRPTSSSACTIGLGPMEANMVGRWIVAARFNNAGVRVESQQPINLVLGDGITSLPVVQHTTYFGETIDLVLNQTQISVVCYLKDPKGQDHDLVSAAALFGVTVHESNNFVSCRVTIGPMTEALLGQWTLIERHYDGTERLQPITINWANWQDPHASREIITSESQTAIADRQGIVTLNGERHEVGHFEGCFISPPNAGVLPIFANHRYPGITHAGARSTTPCIVELGPVDLFMVGEWILASRFNDNGQRIERRLSVYVEMNSMSPESLTTLIVVLCVVCAVLLVVGGVLAFKRTRQWTTQKIRGLRSTFRSSGSRNEIVRNDHQMQENHPPNLNVESPTKSRA